MGEDESDEHLRIFKCLIDTGSHVLRNAIGIKLLNNNSIGFVQYLKNNKHQFYHQFEKKIWRKCCLGSPHGCVFTGTMDKKIFNKMYNKTAEQNTQDCLDRFETNAGISLDRLDLSDLNFFLWNSSSLSAQEEHSLKKIMSIRSTICHPPSSHSYSTDELEIHWNDLKSAVLLFAEPKCYKDIVEMQVETLQNCKLNVIESAKVIEKMKIESAKILRAIKQETTLKIVEKLIKDETCGLENCVKSENNKTKSYINDTFQEFKEHHEVLSTRCREEIQSTVTQESSNTRLHSEDQSRAIDTKLTESAQRVCQTMIQSQGRLEDKLIEEQNKTRNHTVELKADLMEENRILKDEFMDVKTELKALKTILIGYIGKQKVDLVMNTDQIAKSTESPDKRKVDFTAKFNQTHVTADKENEIIEKLPPEAKIQTNNDSSPEAEVTETIEITGKRVNSIILELKATPGILHSVETFKAAILTLVQVMQKAGGIDVDIEDTVTVNLKFESSLTEDQFAIVKRLFAKEWNGDNDTTQLLDECSFIFDEYLSTGDGEEIEFQPELDIYSQKETSESVQPESTEAFTKPSCKYCDDKDKIIRILEDQNEKSELSKSQLISELERTSLVNPLHALRDNIGRISNRGKLGLKQKESKSDHLGSFVSAQTYGLHDEDSKPRDLSSKTVDECRNCYEKDEIIIQLDRRLCEIRRRVIEAKTQSVSGNNFLEDLLQFIHQNTNMTSVEEKGRMKYKELKSVTSSQQSELISDVDVHDPEKKANKNLMESEARQGRRPELDQTEEKSDLSLRISEIRREYASSYYTKTDKQKGLGIILQGQRSTYFQHARDPDIRYLQEFFEEIGFVSKCMVEMDFAQLKKSMIDQNFYCIFIVFTGFMENEDEYLIRHLLSKRSIVKPVIIMTKYTYNFPHISKINEDNDMLILMPINQIGRGTDPYRYYREKNIFEDFVKAARSNRFADIMDILTRMNALYDYPIITFQSSLRKKFCFL